MFPRSPLFALIVGLFPIACVYAQQPAEPRVWKAVQSWPAAEAHQAAAADDRYFYAISSTAVAKYDRATGKLVATSSGKATHLNSGFFWEGMLYCAHSNYPKQPEQSEIRRLDPARMELSTFKDFGSFAGSLTWCIRHDGHWWCNFAHYGAANSKTVLVKFDADWKEVGRWTYPPEVIAKLGGNSLSGGVWHGGELLCTGHDDPVLFRLQLPQAGTVLEYLGSEKSPFTGQGIAADPKSGGLVGIDRSKRRVIAAERSSGPAAQSR